MQRKIEVQTHRLDAEQRQQLERAIAFFNDAQKALALFESGPADLLTEGNTVSVENLYQAYDGPMGKRRQGVILTLSTPAGRTASPGHLGYSVTCAGVEAFSRVLAAELGPRNIRVVCLGPHAISDAPQAGSYTGQLFAPKASAMGLTVEQWLGGGAQTTMLGRLPTLEDVAQTAAFLASDKARSMTAAYVNLTAGMIPE